ncbi:zinc finger protein 567-like [Myzus persicae]|uniref:zinc finger protein 567-like n=1 Tax=Myzus persicae TaxID=13164 RepID=UPI000B931C9A|nr:zinc finger protein 567-like [Myzus persicae]
MAVGTTVICLQSFQTYDTSYGCRMMPLNSTCGNQVLDTVIPRLKTVAVDPPESTTVKVPQSPETEETINNCDLEFTPIDVSDGFCKGDSGRTQSQSIYTCHCEASFKHKSWYLKHQLTHGAGTFECDKCSKVFKRKDNLRRHLTKHFGGTIYKCQKCPSTFNMKFNLSYHMKTKHGNVCFSCPKCDKNFCDSRQLNYHDNRIHTGLMPFECIVCNMRFHAPNDLYRHRKLKNH